MEVVDFRSKKTELSHDQQEIIAVLEKWVERAKLGEFTGIAIAGVLNDGTAVSVLPPSNDFVRVIASTALLASRAIHDCSKSTDGSPA